MKAVLLSICMLLCSIVHAQNFYTIGITPAAIGNPDSRLAMELGYVNQTKGFSIFSNLGYIRRSDIFSQFVHPLSKHDNYVNGTQGGFMGDVIASVPFRPQYTAGLLAQYKYASASFDDVLANAPFIKRNNNLYKQRFAFAAVVTNYCPFAADRFYASSTIGIGASTKQYWLNGQKVRSYFENSELPLLTFETSSGSTVFFIMRVSVGVQIGARKKTSSFKEK
jgi:hypothetical protein